MRGFRIETVRRAGPGLLTLALAAAACAAAAGLLQLAFCAYTWSHDRLSDYGIYLNMMWNTGHGHPFRYLVDASYLRVHLSFTVGLAGFLFRLWDHPFLPVLLQWLASVLGALVLAWTARRQRLPAVFAASIAFFYLAYRFTQSVHAHEFHGIAFYLLLIPLLYATLALRRAWAWLPLALLLGVREDAFLAVLPMLLYFAARDRWRGGAWLFAAALAYGALALFVLYPAINGISILDKRSPEISPHTLRNLFEAGPVEARLRALALVLLPVLAAAGRRWGTALLFPSAAVLACMGSAWPSQYGIGTHYSAPVVACLACGLIEAAARRRADEEQGGRRCRWTATAAALAVVTLLVHVESGFLPGGGKSARVFRTVNIGAIAILDAAWHIPREGTLLTDDDYVAFCGNRADLRVCHVWKRGEPFDHVFVHVRELDRLRGGFLADLMRSGELGVRYFDGMSVVLSRGADTSANADVLSRHAREQWFYETAHHGGRNVYHLGLPCRYWWGNGSRSPVNLSYGGHWELDPGRYNVTFVYRAAEPERAVRRHWGWFSLHVLDAPEDLLRAYIPPTPARDDTWQTFTMSVTLRERTKLECRVTGADAPLWLSRVYWRPAADAHQAGTCRPSTGRAASVMMPCMDATVWDEFAHQLAGAPERDGVPAALADTAALAWPPIEQFLLSGMGTLAGRRVLDYGCGTGHFSRHLAHLGARVTGIDASPAMAAEAASRPVAGVEIRTGGLDALRADDRFDAVTLIMVTPFVRDLDALFDALARALAPGGRLALVTYNPGFVRALLRAGRQFRDFDSVDLPRAGHLDLAPAGSVPVHIRYPEEYAYAAEARDLRLLLEARPPFTADFLRRHPQPFPTDTPEFLVLGFGKGEVRPPA